MVSRSEREEIKRAFKYARRSGTGWWRADCPLCVRRVGKVDRKGCLAINVASGAFFCWKCQASGKLEIDGYETLTYNAEQEPVVSIGPPEGFISASDAYELESEALAPAWSYLETRVPRNLWAETGIGACASGKYAGRVIIPILAADQQTWLGWVGRTWYPSDLTYQYPPGMRRGEILYRSWILQEKTDDPVMVVEGVFDALALYPNAVAVLGKASEAQMEALQESKRPVVIVLDGDAWQEGWAMAARLKFKGQRAGSVRLPPKLDPDEVDPAWLQEEVKKALL